jgi:ABC-type multidrug transport system ATPase subunit
MCEQGFNALSWRVILVLKVMFRDCPDLFIFHQNNETLFARRFGLVNRGPALSGTRSRQGGDQRTVMRSHQRLTVVAVLAVCVVLQSAAAAPKLESDICAPCGPSNCLSRLCRAGACGAAFVKSQYESRGWLVNMPTPCVPGQYTCAEDPEDASLICNRGACAFDTPCAPPRLGDVRLQPTELTQLLEMRLGQTPKAPPSGLLMVYGIEEPDRWSFTCADSSEARDHAADVVCRQVGHAYAASSDMVNIPPLLDSLSAAFKGPGSGASLSDWVTIFSDQLRSLYGARAGKLSGLTHSMRACGSDVAASVAPVIAAPAVGRVGPAPVSTLRARRSGARRLAEARPELPTSILNCTGAPLVKGTCSRTIALHVTCSTDRLAGEEAVGTRHRPDATIACGSAGVSKLPFCKRADEGAKPERSAAAAACPPLFLPNPQVVAGDLYCIHYPMHRAQTPAERERAFRLRIAAGLARGASSAGLPADSEAAADEEATRECEEAVASGDMATTMDRCSAASGFAHPAAAAALAQAYANGANDAAAKAAAEEAGINGINAQLAAAAPPPEDPLSGVTLPPVICYLGPASPEVASGRQSESAAAAWDSSGLLRVAGAPQNAGNATACGRFDTHSHCPTDRWAAVLLPSGAYMCAGTAPKPSAQPPAANLPERVRRAAGIFEKAPSPFVLCHQTGPNPVSAPQCEPRTEPLLKPDILSPIGLHLDPRPQARSPNARAADGAADGAAASDDEVLAVARVTESGLAPSAPRVHSSLAPELCAAGVYCPNLFNRTVCPRGSFCWQGSVAPAPCAPDLLGGVLARVFGGPLGALLGAPPVGSAHACPPGASRPPPRVDFLLLLGLLLCAVLVGLRNYDLHKAARTAVLSALGEDAGLAQRSTAALYIELDSLYTKATAVLAPALLTPLPSSKPSKPSWPRTATKAAADAATMQSPSAFLRQQAPAMFGKGAAASDGSGPFDALQAGLARGALALRARVARTAEAAARAAGMGEVELPGWLRGPDEEPPSTPPFERRSTLNRAAMTRTVSQSRVGTARTVVVPADSDDDDPIVVPPAMHASVERARRRQADGLSAIHPDSEAPFAKLPDRISFQFKRLGMRVRAPAAVAAARRRKLAALRIERGLRGGVPPDDEGDWMEVLNSVSGSIDHSTLTAIMGVSGCGKSTFMNVLCGRAHYGIPTGSLRVNGSIAEPERYRNRLGFVPQDDTVREALTVYENILYAAQLRLPRGTHEGRVVGLVHEVIEMLGLQSVRDSVVGSAEQRGISGGQRKRVNIGLELAADPLALFLDEPTSGLDACTAELVLSALRSLARRGRTIVMVLHQPRYTAFKLLDRLILLGVGGRTLFCGEPLKVVPYFASVGYQMRYGENPADFMLDVVSGLVPRDTKRSAERERAVAERNGRSGAAAGGRALAVAAPRALDRRPSTTKWAYERVWRAGGSFAARAGVLPAQPPSPTFTDGTSMTAEPRESSDHLGPMPRGLSGRALAPAALDGKPGEADAGSAGGVATTAILAECWSRLGNTVSNFESEAAPTTALFTQEQQLAVLRVFDATIEAAWPADEREGFIEPEPKSSRRSMDPNVYEPFIDPEVKSTARTLDLSSARPARAAAELAGADKAGAGAGAAGAAPGGEADGGRQPAQQHQYHPPPQHHGGGGGAHGASVNVSRSSSMSSLTTPFAKLATAYIFRDLLTELSNGVVLPTGVRLSSEATSLRARNRWRAACRALQLSRAPLKNGARAQQPPNRRTLATDGNYHHELGVDEDGDEDETASLPDIPAPSALHTRSRRLARGHPTLSQLLATAAHGGALPVGDWAAFMQALQDLASMSVITRAQVDLVGACMLENLLRASDAAGIPLVSTANGSPPPSPNGSVADGAGDDLNYYDDAAEDAPAAAELEQWDTDTAHDAMRVLLARAELVALLRITDDNSVEGVLEVHSNGKLSASDFYQYQVRTKEDEG